MAEPLSILAVTRDPEEWKSLEGIAGKAAGRGEPFVVFDELGAGIGSRIAVSEGTEAAAPFYPEVKPIDAYNAAILDQLEFQPL